MLRMTSIYLGEKQMKEIVAAAKPDGLSMAALIRIFINEGLARRKRAALKQTK